MATIYEVSELAGVSLATVSRVMNKNANVSDVTREKVTKAMEQLGYRPNTIAQSLASNRSNSVGVLISELSGPYYGPMMSGIEAELTAAEKHVIIAAGHSDEKTEIDGIEFLIGRRCDALILNVEAVSDDYLIALSKKSTPIYLINRYIPELADICISLNNELGGYIATKSVLEQGHTQVAYISGPSWKMDASERLIGHKRALTEYNLTVNDNLIFEGNYQESGGSEAMQHFLQQHDKFTAVICGNDEMASGAMTVAREHGLSLPKDLSIVGFDDVTFARYLYPKLTTIHYPVNEMGHMSARLVLKNTYEDKKLIITNIFEPDLVVRDSVTQVES